jgi:hypothetical protein
VLIGHDGQVSTSGGLGRQPNKPSDNMSQPALGPGSIGNNLGVVLMNVDDDLPVPKPANESRHRYDVWIEREKNPCAALPGKCHRSNCSNHQPASGHCVDDGISGSVSGFAQPLDLHGKPASAQCAHYSVESRVSNIVRNREHADVNYCSTHGFRDPRA